MRMVFRAWQRYTRERLAVWRIEYAATHARADVAANVIAADGAIQEVKSRRELALRVLDAFKVYVAHRREVCARWLGGEEAKFVGSACASGGCCMSRAGVAFCFMSCGGVFCTWAVAPQIEARKRLGVRHYYRSTLRRALRVLARHGNGRKVARARCQAHLVGMRRVIQRRAIQRWVAHRDGRMTAHHMARQVDSFRLQRAVSTLRMHARSRSIRRNARTAVVHEAARTLRTAKLKRHFHAWVDLHHASVLHRIQMYRAVEFHATNALARTVARWRLHSATAQLRAHVRALNVHARCRKCFRAWRKFVGARRQHKRMCVYALHLWKHNLQRKTFRKLKR